MNKKLTILAAGALTALAFAALPSVAAAGTWNCETTAAAICGTFDGTNKTVTKLTVHNSESEVIECSENTVHGEYKTKTTGENLTITFHGCKAPGIGECNSPGQPAGTIKTFDLDFHNILIHAGTPGILLTPNTANKEFATFTCAGIATIHVAGNGVIGHLTRTCGTEAAKGALSTLDFDSVAPGTQKWTQITTTGEPFDLVSIKTFFGTTTKTASQDGSGTITFPNSATKVIC